MFFCIYFCFVLYFFLALYYYNKNRGYHICSFWYFYRRPLVSNNIKITAFGFSYFHCTYFIQVPSVFFEVFLFCLQCIAWCSPLLNTVNTGQCGHWRDRLKPSGYRGFARIKYIYLNRFCCRRDKNIWPELTVHSFFILYIRFASSTDIYIPRNEIETHQDLLWNFIWFNNITDSIFHFIIQSHHRKA